MKGWVVPVYDTSGPYSDVDAKLDVTKGIERFRESWILERGDAEQLDDMTSAYGRARRENHELDHLRFNAEHHPLRAKAGHHLTQLDYARKGIITKEMEYVAIRENQRLDELQAQGWRIPLRGLPRGDYQCVVWCGLEEATESYSLPRMHNGRSRIEELSCRLQRNRNASQAAEVGEIQPLFHGSIQLREQVHFEGSDTATVHLTKDRNSLRVILQENSPLGADTRLLTASITDCNGLLNYDNRPLDDETLLYRPCYTDYAAADPSVASAAGANVALMEFTLNRLWIDPDRENRLTVYHRQSGDTVLSIPLNRYLCLAREHYQSELSDQEYLDRQDNYSLTFFLQQGRWVGSQVVVNSWKMIVSDEKFD